MVMQRARDYGKITEFQKVIACEKFPNGVLIGPDGALFVCHYFGQLSIYDSSFSLVSVRQAALSSERSLRSTVQTFPAAPSGKQQELSGSSISS